MKSSSAALAVRALGMIFAETVVFVLSALLISSGALPPEALISEWSKLNYVHSVKCGRLPFWKRCRNPLTLTDEGRSLDLLPHAGPGLILKPKA